MIIKLVVNMNPKKLLGGRKERGDTSVFGIWLTILRGTPAKKSLKMEAILEGDEMMSFSTAIFSIFALLGGLPMAILRRAHVFFGFFLDFFRLLSKYIFLLARSTLL
jgi:hypothetical protein